MEAPSFGISALYNSMNLYNIYTCKTGVAAIFVDEVKLAITRASRTFHFS